MSHLLFMDVLKVYGKSKQELDKLIEIVHVFSSDIGIEFGLYKCSLGD